MLLLPATVGYVVGCFSTGVADYDVACCWPAGPSDSSHSSYWVTFCWSAANHISIFCYRVALHILSDASASWVTDRIVEIHVACNWPMYWPYWQITHCWLLVVILLCSAELPLSLLGHLLVTPWLGLLPSGLLTPLLDHLLLTYWPLFWIPIGLLHCWPAGYLVWSLSA